MTNAITATNWFNTVYILSQIETGSNLPPRLVIVFLLPRDASIPLLNLTTYNKILQNFIVFISNQNDISKTITMANQSEFPLKQCISQT